MAKSAMFDKRELMRKAIAAMKESISEPRNDGKASPLVGAVLWKSDGTIETACRGELRMGDHAEFTLLERKNRASKLDGSVLFATLEPCAPGARNHPKMCCAERIVNARIRKVWVGIEDPDPTVDRKGIKFLQDSGIEVHMFDRDLQDEIRDANKDFIGQAMGRRLAADSVVKDVVLSFLENPVVSVEMRDLSVEALERYRHQGGIDYAVGSDDFNRHLRQLRVLSDERGQPVPTGFGSLLFGRSPRDVMPQAGLLGTIHLSDGSEDVQDFAGPMVFVPEQAIQWLIDKLPNPIDRSGAGRKQAIDKFYELVREGIVNALVHRDYENQGAKCHLVVSPEAIVIKSPGAPVAPITLENLQAFDAPMLSRNPVLHYVFAKMKLAEERGLGLKSLRSRAAEIGLPLPTYSWEDPYLSLSLYRRSDSATKMLEPSVLSQLSGKEQAGWTFLASRTGTTQSEYAKALGLNARTAQRHLTHFVELGLMQRIGGGRSTEYVKL